MSEYALGFVSDYIKAVNDSDLATLMKMYEPEAVFIPEFEGQLIRGTDGIREYFVRFLSKFPKVEHIGQEINQTIHSDGHRVISGEFLYSWPDSPDSDLAVRFTFVVNWEEGVWLISTQHNSCSP